MVKTGMPISLFLAERQLMQYQQLNMIPERMQSSQIPTTVLLIYFNLERDLTWGTKVHGKDVQKNKFHTSEAQLIKTRTEKLGLSLKARKAKQPTTVTSYLTVGSYFYISLKW